MQAQPAAGAGAGQAGAAAGGGSLEFLRSNQQFQALRQLVQANPQILQPMLQVCLMSSCPLCRVLSINSHIPFPLSCDSFSQLLTTTLSVCNVVHIAEVRN